MVWLRESDISHAWGKVKHIMGHAWHKGGNLIGSIDKYADLGIRLLGATAPMLRPSALQAGVGLANEYGALRQKAGAFQRGVDQTANRFRAAAPELGI